LRFGFGLFETLLSVDGKPVAWDRHIARMESTAARFGMAMPEAGELRAGLDELLGSEGFRNGTARVRIGLTGGTGGLDLEPGAESIAWIEASPFSPPSGPASVALCPWTRNERDPLAGHKCSAYAGNLVALDWAKRHDLDEPLFANNRGELCEGATTNVFFALDGVVRTPLVSTGCLPGVTRAIVLELGRSHGVPMEEGEFASGLLSEATEMLLTSSLRGIQPVARCGARDLPAPGALTKRLIAAYEKWQQDARSNE
jgi:branched-subunit amino acid aminotransferase/4-amino-4-deoxychorismate lyase